MRQNKVIEIVNSYLDDVDLPDNLIDFIKWLNDVKQSIPPDYIDTAAIEFDAGEYSLSFKITYTRPETDEEMGKTEAEEEVRQKILEERELDQLAKLRAKYETK